MDRERELEHEIIHTRNYMESIMERTQTVITVLDSDLTIRIVNRAWEDFCGTERSLPISTGTMESFPFTGSGEREMFKHKLTKSFEGEVTQLADFPVKCGRDVKNMNIILNPLRIHGAVTCVILSGNECTEGVSSDK